MDDNGLNATRTERKVKRMEDRVRALERELEDESALRKDAEREKRSLERDVKRLERDLTTARAGTTAVAASGGCTCIAGVGVELSRVAASLIWSPSSSNTPLHAPLHGSPFHNHTRTPTHPHARTHTQRHFRLDREAATVRVCWAPTSTLLLRTCRQLHSTRASTHRSTIRRRTKTRPCFPMSLAVTDRDKK